MGRELSDDIADDLGSLFTDPADFGLVVTHSPRAGTGFNINAAFNQTQIQVPLKDDRQGRNKARSAFLTMGTKDVNGATISIDEQGEFLVQGQRWAIGDVSVAAGGYVVTLVATDRQTIRHLPGNS